MWLGSSLAQTVNDLICKKDVYFLANGYRYRLLLFLCYKKWTKRQNQFDNNVNLLFRVPVCHKEILASFRIGKILLASGS